MLVAWHPTRWWDLCMPHDKKKIELFFTDESMKVLVLLQAK